MSAETEKCRCRHCGATYAREAGVGDFCSPGCAAVHARIMQGGLGRFYELRGEGGAPVGAAAFQPRDFTWLAEAVRGAEAKAGRTAELIVEVQGITCVGCVWLIERLFQRRPGSVQLDINATHGRMFWRWEPGRFDAVGLARELHDFGYIVGPEGEKAEAGHARALRLRLGLCAAFAMNTMLFVLPAYLGLARSSEFYALFEALAGVFATAALVTGGGYFARRAWAGLRAGAMTIDVPITLGLAIGFAGSIGGWIAGLPHLVYFDFVAVFSFLMLVGRWTQETAVERNRLQLLSYTREPADVLVAGADGSLRRAAVRTLSKGQVFALRSGQVVPVAATLLSEGATVTTEWINGEPEPRVYRRGQLLPPGATTVGLDEIRCEAAEAWHESALARLLASSGAGGFRHVLAERVIRVYLYVVVALALAGGAAWWWLGDDPLKAVHVTLALLVASCPCGIGVALPLVEELAVAAMRRHGVFVRELTVFTRIFRVRKVLFDKTGTLTLESPVLENPEALERLDARARRRLWRLVAENRHPIARALHEALVYADDSDPGDGAVHETVGEGIALGAPDGCWTLGRPGFGGIPASSEPGATLFAHDGRLLAAFRFAESARADARRELAALRGRGLEVWVLSGDHPEKVAALARSLGLPEAQALGALSPDGKQRWIESAGAGDTMMLGDGANDSLAFDAALVRGTPVIHRGVLEAKSDFYYLGRGLGGVRRLFEVAAVRRRAARRVFAFAVAYNAGTVVCALAGYINPIVAAVIMPVSSLLSLGLATVTMRRARRD